MKSKTKNKKVFAVFLDGNGWEGPVYSDDISHDPRDCYSEEALFACAETSVLIGQEKQSEEDTYG